MPLGQATNERSGKEAIPSPSGGRLGWGWVVGALLPHPHPNPPLEGRGLPSLSCLGSFSLQHQAIIFLLRSVSMISGITPGSSMVEGT